MPSASGGWSDVTQESVQLIDYAFRTRPGTFGPPGALVLFSVAALLSRRRRPA